jgi:hypothetical protein
MGTLTKRAALMLRAAGNASREGRLEVAEALYRQWMAEEPQDPRPAYGLSTLLLLRGEYLEGFRLYEARCYVPETGVVKPEYQPRPLPLSPQDREGWGRQEMNISAGE